MTHNFMKIIYLRDIVDAAHLKPLSREEKMNSCTKRARWNPAI